MTVGPTGQTVLVTGGAGFVGSHLVDALRTDNEVRVFDDFSTGDRGNVPEEGVEVIDADLRDREALAAATADVDTIFHQAAIVSVDRTVDEPRTSHDINATAALDVLELARDRDARVVLASSCAIYGHPTTTPIPESEPQTPTSPYGLQKAVLDGYARLYADLYGLAAVPLRYFNVYGPRQRDGPYSGVIRVFLRQAREGGPITVHGDGSQTRDFVHVSDVVRANLLAATTDEVGVAYNVGTGETISVRRLAEAVRDAVDSDAEIVHVDERPGDIERSVADTTRARDRLGFEAAVGLAEGLADLVETA
jgi:UDP-glucose 4-epimerase